MTKKWLFLWLAAALLLTVFIYLNSAKSSEASHQSSGKFEEILLEGTDVPVGSSFGHIIRKAAHLLEYALLGITVSGMVWQVRRLYGRSVVGFGCFYLLAAAVVDEYIQSFYGRTSVVSDVLLDFAGGLIGFAFSYAVCLLWHHRKSSRNPHPGKE